MAVHQFEDSHRPQTHAGPVHPDRLCKRSAPSQTCRFSGWTDGDCAATPALTGCVEVKAAATVTSSDFRGLRKLKEAAGKRFTSGVVLYDGEISVGFGEGFQAVPIRLLWETR